MTNKQISILIIVLLIASVFIYILTIFYDDKQMAINQGLSIISTLSTLITIILAFFLYNRFGIEANLLDRQNNEVFKLYEMINDMDLIIETESTSSRFVPSRKYTSTNILFFIFEERQEKSPYFSKYYFDLLSGILAFSENIFIPKEIAIKIRMLNIKILLESEISIVDIEPRDLTISSRKKEYYSDRFYKVYKSLDDKKEYLLKDFLNDWSELTNEINKWISNNSALKNLLNVE